MKQIQGQGFMGAESAQQFIIRRYHEYRQAEKQLHAAQSTKLYWGKKMAEYNAAKKRWILAESLASTLSEKIVLR